MWIKLDFSEKKIQTMKMSRRTVSMSAVAHTEDTGKKEEKKLSQTQSSKLEEHPSVQRRNHHHVNMLFQNI